MLYCVGKKGTDYFSRRDYQISAAYPGIFSSLNYTFAHKIVDELISMYVAGSIDKVIVIYNEFKSIIQQRIVIEQFLPIPVNNESRDIEHKNTYYIYEPDQKYIFNYLIPKHLKGQMWKMLLESNAAEHASRMTAMDNATTNAKELIRTLNLTYNKERQASITKEILEIVSGANALKESY
jgi:F-type H+-transporting ATPase subunit gamma